MSGEPYQYNPSDPTQFGNGAIITPGATDLDPLPKSVVLLTAGNVTVVPDRNANGTTLAFVDLPTGDIGSAGIIAGSAA